MLKYTIGFLLLLVTTMSVIASSKAEDNKVLSVLSASALPQNPGILDPIDWTSSIEQNGDEATLKFTATLDEGWHLYSQFLDPDKIGPIPTTFSIKTDKNFSLQGKVKEPQPKVEYDPNFDMELGYFSKKVTFTQKIKIKSEKDFKIKAEVEFMVCDDMRCLPPDFIEFEFSVKGVKAKKTNENEQNGDEETDEIETDESEIDSSEAAIDTTQTKEDENEGDSDNELESNEEQDPEEEKDNSLWYIFFGGFAGGLIALLTPCVFPLIPMTVAFFTKGSQNRSQGIRRAALYGFFIVAIYVTIGLLITGIFGATALNEMSTSAVMNIIFFLVFLVFAASFLGAFEIRLPSKWINKADKAADRGGWLGIFFMAFTLGLVSFSCTGPIIGSLIVEAANVGSYSGPAMGMFGFSLALAIPFSLFAVFPNWLNGLPQSGGWLNSVKVVLGLLEVALAFKFLSVADMAYHWEILTREVFVAIWIVVFGIMGFYLLGKIRFAHDSPVEKISVTRFSFAFIVLTFTVYMIPGMFGAPLKLLSGLAPPKNYSEDKFIFVRGESTPGVYSQGDEEMLEYRKHMHEVGVGVWVFHDLEMAQEYAIKTNKPIMLDFTGYGCVNCRKMEENVWSTEAVKPMLKNDIVIASLYVDDREKLPESEVRYSEVIGKEVRTIGHKWAEYQIKKYNSNSQPLYIIVDHELNDLTKPVGYVSTSEYEKFLKQGLKKFKEQAKSKE